jgi:hypothetical protein
VAQLVVLAGCADGLVGDDPFGWWHDREDPPGTAERCDAARDRKAILKMAGTFEVSFFFEEVEALAPGYALREPYQTYGTEVVSVLADEPGRVSLQHVLLIDLGDDLYYPLKHWRQDWAFEDSTLLEFQGRRVWEQRSLDQEQAHCAWSQAVFQVDDGPRYESYGQFEHTGSTSTWTSESTWRPLPRRETSQRSDYDVLVAINTHVITDDGWTHEEDNLKWVLDSQSAIARERGLNEYRRVSLPAEAVAHEYLEVTGAFWREVRDEWAVLLDDQRAVRVHEVIDGVPLFDVLLPLADELATAEPAVRKQAIHETISPYVEALD